MVKKISAGLLMYRLKDGELEVFLAHPGGPYFKNKDCGYWGIPKGEVETQESLLAAAVREFQEETGIVPQGEYLPLGSTTLTSGKTVFAWAFAGDWDTSLPLKSNQFEMEWPPYSGKKACFPEIDQVAFFSLLLVDQKITPAQAVFVTRLQEYLLSATPAAD
ncbi:MAG: NUDIX domain-containing protein [Negativicutes bacterium]|nr:NUDIX domain-containing protein [Negativicutes bacterium]